jgi:uncharacterized membrane protein
MGNLPIPPLPDVRIAPLPLSPEHCHFAVIQTAFSHDDFRIAIMALRTFHERCLQSFVFQLGGIALVTPIYAILTRSGAVTSGSIVIAVAIACLIWSPFHNTVFDWVEWHMARRVASDRPQGLRMVHAISHEVTSIIVSTPVLVVFGGLGVMQALIVDLGLTAFYTGYAYVFNIIYDRWRPVLAQSSGA